MATGTGEGDNASAGKDIPESIFADDDGSADALLAQALIRHARGKAHLSDVVEALAYARVLVPVLASGHARHIGHHGLEQDEVASTGVVAVELPDGRTALPIFTDVEAMAAWNPTARPIPAEGPRAALAAIAEDWSVLLINPARETVAIPRPAVWALGRGEPWRPAVMDGAVDPEVRAAIRDAISLAGPVLEADAVAGTGAEVTVVVGLASGLDREELTAALERVQAELAASDIVAERIDSLELRVVAAN